MKRLPYEPARTLIKCTFWWVLVSTIPKALGILTWRGSFEMPMFIANAVIVSVFSLSALYSLVAVVWNAVNQGQIDVT